MEFRLLGPLEVLDGDRAVPVVRRQQRALLGALLVRAGEVVATERLIDELWGDDPPRSAVGSLQNTISQLRKLLGAELVLTQAPGYRLAVAPGAVDARRFERLLGEAAGLEPPARAAALREALALWRGPALADLGDEPWVQAEATRLEELRLTALEERIEAELELARHATLVAQLEALAAEHPLRERLRRQLALALYRSGRQAEALEACRAARAALDELGLEPSPELRQLERDILRQSPALAAPTEGAAPSDEEAPGERRAVSVLAADMPEEDDPEKLRAALARVLAAAGAAVGRHGGSIERFGPEGMSAVFGADGSREDDALRAVRAGVELREAAGVAVGVATGEALVGGEPHVSASAVARASGLARAGDGVLVDSRTYELVRHAVTAETAGPVARVLGVTAVRSERGTDVPLVGRQGELERLQGAFAAVVAERRCRAVGVVGEPGIGKSRLARELARSIDAVVLVGRCAAYGEGASFLPVVEALAGLDPAAVMHAEDDARLVTRRLAQLDGDAREPGSLGELLWAVRRLLETLARVRPVALILDDVHWAEPALLDLVEYLGARVTDAPLFVLTLARPELHEVRPAWAADAVGLGPLGEADTRRLVDAAGRTLDDDVRDRIVELAEGNALYAEQLAAYAAESGRALERGAMPATLEAVLAGRLGRLEAGERATLQLAAVTGREFTNGAVAALAPADLAVDAHLLALARRGFVRAATRALPGGDAYRFHHVLLRDAAEATLTKADRASLHERCAAWLDRDGHGDDALAGYHLEQAALLRRELGEDADELAAEAGARLGEAGMRAWRQNDARPAASLLRRATDLLPAGERRAELLCELAVALDVAGEAPPANAALRRAVTEAVGERTAARAALEDAIRGVAAGTTTPDELAALARAARDACESEGDHRGSARAWIAVYWAELYACRYIEQLAAAREALRFYRLAHFSPALAFEAIGMALIFGPPTVADAVAECGSLLEEATDRRAEAHVTACLAALAAMEGRTDDSWALLTRARSVFDEIGVRLGGIWCELLVRRRSGDLEDALKLARVGAAHSREQGKPAYESTYLCQEADALLASGRTSEAAAAVERARPLALEYDVYVQALLRSHAARVAARGGETERAATLARAAVDLVPDDAVTVKAGALVALAEVESLRDGDDAAETATGEAERLLLAKGDLVGAEQARRELAAIRL